MRFTRTSDRIFVTGTLILGAAVLLATIGILIGITNGASLSLQTFGLGFITEQTWDPVQEVFGALPFIYGTLVTAFIALLLSGLIGIGGAIFLAVLAPSWIRTPVSFM